MQNESVKVELKVKTITGKDKHTLEIKLKEFKKEHFVSHEKWCTDKIVLVFYWED